MKKIRDATLIISPDYLQFIEELKARVVSARVTAARAITHEAILLYWDIGCGIVEKQQQLGWGDSVVEMLASDLQRAFPGAKGFSLANIWRMRQFYLAHNQPEFLAQVARELENPPSGPQPGSFLPRHVPGTTAPASGPNLAQLVRDFVSVVPWGHHVLMLGRMKSPAEHLWYLRATARFGWSRNVLLNQIKAGAYERSFTEKKTHNFDLALPEHFAEQAVEWICVCSDESAGRVERDDSAVLRQDLGVPCLTDPKEITAWLKRKHRGLTVVFTTYQSGEALAKAARATKFSFDLGIMDEAHKTVGDGAKIFSHLLHDKNLPIRRRLFMTATERRYKGQSDTVLSMDDPATYGETFHLLSFKRAMEYDPPILSDYKIISIAVSREEVAELIRKNTFVRPDKGTWNKEIEADMLASLIALRKAMKKYPIQHAVSFHGSIQRAEVFKTHNDAFSKSFRKYGKLETFHVSGKTPTGTRARVIGEFARAERALITNARCLTEGVDVPGIDCVLFADPRRSAVDIVQAVGRALRPAPNKQFGYVIVPILHDADATADEIFKSPAFKEVLTTLRALAANDDRIIEYFRGVSQGQQRKGGGSVQFDIDERLAKRINLARLRPRDRTQVLGSLGEALLAAV